jgi:PAS domain S-box-containing protein
MANKSSGELDTSILKEVVETVPVGVVVYDADGRVLYLNTVYLGLPNRDESAVVGAKIWEVAPTVDQEQFESQWNSVTEAGTESIETESRSDGTRLQLRVTTTKRTINGNVYHLRTVQDVSSQQACEQRLERTNRQLEARNETLQQQNDMLEAQNEQLESFASIASHDLRNPLSVAAGYLELAKQDSDSEALETVSTALSRMDTLIDDLLTLARDGESIGTPEPVGLETLSTDAWENVRTETAELSVENTCLYGDPSRLQQLFENLFRNSVEHGSTDSRSQAGVTIRVGPVEPIFTSTRYDETNQFAAGFFVADDGPGIPVSERESVFEEAYTTAESGTGLGLATVKEIATAHGWQVRCTTSDDGGARFEFIGTGTHPND